jgi:hypothetical protein
MQEVLNIHDDHAWSAHHDSGWPCLLSAQGSLKTAQCGRPSSSNMVWLTHATKYQASIQAQHVGHSLSDNSTYRQ